MRDKERGREGEKAESNDGRFKGKDPGVVMASACMFPMVEPVASLLPQTLTPSFPRRSALLLSVSLSLFPAQERIQLLQPFMGADFVEPLLDLVAGELVSRDE